MDALMKQKRNAAALLVAGIFLTTGLSSALAAVAGDVCTSEGRTVKSTTASEGVLMCRSGVYVKQNATSAPEVDTLATVTARGAATTATISAGAVTIGGSTLNANMMAAFDAMLSTKTAGSSCTPGTHKFSSTNDGVLLFCNSTSSKWTSAAQSGSATGGLVMSAVGTTTMDVASTSGYSTSVPVTVTNNLSTASRSLSGTFTFVGDDKDFFELTTPNSCTASLAPGSSCVVTIRAKAALNATYSAVFLSTANNAPTLPVSGSASGFVTLAYGVGGDAVGGRDAQGTFPVTIPSGYTRMKVTLWGAGGLSVWGNGSAGGFAQGVASVSAGQTYTLRVGNWGTPGVGGTPSDDGGYGARGGYATALLDSSGTELLRAGGGGGSGGHGSSCQTFGDQLPANATASIGGGGTGAGGGSAQAGYGTAGTGGAGGGGGGGIASGCGGGTGYGGQGGPNYAAASLGGVTLTTASYNTAPNSADIDYSAPGALADKGGRAVVRFLP